MNLRDAHSNESTPWLRELASYVDYSEFRRVWLRPITPQSEQGYLAACYERIAEQANKEGEYFLAFDAVEHGLRCAAAAQFPPHVLVARKVTALARSGAVVAAQKVMDDFLISYDPESSVCSAQARLFRDRALAEPDLGTRRRLMSEGADWAGRAKNLARMEGIDWAYPANQEAQFQFLAGELAVARASAAGLISYVESLPDAASMWNQMNLADMYLIRGDLARAGHHYREAALQGADSPGHTAASRAVAKILLEELARHESVDAELPKSWFTRPLVVVFAGHIPDAPDRATRRLPEALCRAGGPVAAEMLKRLEQLKPVEGICASAPGGDILFAEALELMRVRLGLVEPFPRTRIERAAQRRGYDWTERLATVYRSAMRLDPIACAEDADESAQCEYATKVMLGTAILRARRIDADLKALVLWDESDAATALRGGTGEFVNLCEAAGVEVEIINPGKLDV